MCICCHILSEWLEANSLDVIAECFHISNSGIDGIISYFNSAKIVEDKCLEIFKKKWHRYQQTKLKKGQDATEMLCSVEDIAQRNKLWFKSQCFYKKWVQFNSKVHMEKKRLNEDLKYLT